MDLSFSKAIRYRDGLQHMVWSDRENISKMGLEVYENIIHTIIGTLLLFLNNKNIYTYFFLTTEFKIKFSNRLMDDNGLFVKLQST